MPARTSTVTSSTRIANLALALATAAFLARAAHSGSQGAGADADDFITGGGWIDETPNANRADFGFKVGVDHAGDFAGQLNYVDRRADVHLKAESITSYIAIDAVTREFTGTARINGESGFTFTVTVSDVDEPGTADSFEIAVSSGYAAGGVLEGGNIQLHD